MSIPKLNQYVEGQRELGMTDEQIREELLGADYRPSEVDEALSTDALVKEAQITTGRPANYRVKWIYYTVLTLILVGVGGFFLHGYIGNLDPQAPQGWTTLNDANHTYAFAYPPGWSGTATNITNSNCANPGLTCFSILISTGPLIPATEYKAQLPHTSSATDVIVGGKQALRVVDQKLPAAPGATTVTYSESVVLFGTKHLIQLEGLEESPISMALTSFQNDTQLLQIAGTVIER